MTILPPPDPRDTEVRARLRPPVNPVAMLISPLGWGAVLYCATSIIGGVLALVAGIIGIVVFPLVAWVTATVESVRLNLLGIRRLGPPPSGRVRHPWDPRGVGEGNLAVWGISVLFAMVDLVPGGVLVLLVLGLATRWYLLFSQPDPIWFDYLGLPSALVVVLVIGLYIGWALAAAQALLVESLLRPKTELRAQVEQLTTSRRELVDIFAAERQRIERDLHDGAQQRLVALAMHLGMAKERYDRDPEGTRALLDEAHAEAKRAMVELRDLARGVHPAVLTDRGLGPALSAVAARSAVPVSVDVAVTGRLDETTEGIAYFVACEALANVAKHSRATEARVVVRRRGDRLVLEVTDDGIGGAVPTGSGLQGLKDRVEGVDGWFHVASPPGGPTTLLVELPCAS